MDGKLPGYDKQLADIEKYGLHVIHVLEDESGPGFTYSVGLFHTYQHPEIIIVGLQQELSHALINDIADDIKKGVIYEHGLFYDNILEDFKCLMLKVDSKNYDQYFGQASRFYKNDEFPVLQCIYPTIKGIYPWEPGWPENLKDLQPLLGKIK